MAIKINNSYCTYRPSRIKERMLVWFSCAIAFIAKCKHLIAFIRKHLTQFGAKNNYIERYVIENMLNYLDY